jgi:hypothetical protein
MVFGTMNLVVSVPVENENETLALMEANYKFANIIGYEMYAIDCRGNRQKVFVHESKADLNEFVE